MKRIKLTTTFERLKEAAACESGYRKLAKYLGGIKAYGRDTPVNLLTILDSNGVDDMLWCLPHTIELSEKVSRLMAADFAEEVLPIFEAKYPKDTRPREAVRAARDHANGKIDDKDLAAARDAAGAAAGDAAWAAARAAAGDAAWAAARAAARDAAWAAAKDLAAARAAARDAARAAARAAAKDLAAARDAAGDAAGDAARAAAWDAARDAQSKIIRSYLTEVWK